MATVINTTFKLKRGLAARWAELNPILQQGEPGFVLDQNRLKIGNGETPWNDLPFLDSESLIADNETIVIDGNVIKLKGFVEAQAGAQLVKGENGELTWKLPSTETVDGLVTAIALLQTEMLEVQEDVGLLNQMVLTGENNLLNRVTTVENQINGTGPNTVEDMINQKIDAFAAKITDDDTINTLSELFEYVSKHGSEVQGILSDIDNLESLIGTESVESQIEKAIAANNQKTEEEVANTFVSKDESAATTLKKKYEILHAPEGTLVDYNDKEIRVMCPVGTEFAKQTVGAGGNANTYYMTFRTYAPNDAVGYKEHLGNQSDAEVLTDLKTDMYGRKYQQTWLGMAAYDEASDTWTYFGKNSTAKKYIGWDYGVDWYGASGTIIASDRIRINLSNEACHNVIEPYYMANTVQAVSINGTVLDAIDRKVDIKLSNAFVVNGNEIDIKQVTWDQIVPGETELILDGGDADLRG
jgi:hypothetical protein